MGGQQSRSTARKDLGSPPTCASEGLSPHFHEVVFDIRMRTLFLVGRGPSLLVGGEELNVITDALCVEVVPVFSELLPIFSKDLREHLCRSVDASDWSKQSFKTFAPRRQRTRLLLTIRPRDLNLNVKQRALLSQEWLQYNLKVSIPLQQICSFFSSRTYIAGDTVEKHKSAASQQILLLL